MENNELTAKFICLNTPDFYELIEALYDRLKDKNKGEKWVNSEIAMSVLNISSPTTLQKIRDSGALRVSYISPKIILYDRDSLDEYLESKARK